MDGGGAGPAGVYDASLVEQVLQEQPPLPAGRAMQQQQQQQPDIQTDPNLQQQQQQQQPDIQIDPNLQQQQQDPDQPYNVQNPLQPEQIPQALPFDSDPGASADPPGVPGGAEAAHLYHDSFLEGLRTHFSTSQVNEGAAQVTAATDVGVSAALTALQFNLLLFALLVGGYEVFSRLVPSVYAGRRQHVGSERMVVDLPHSYLPLGWIPVVVRTSWGQVRKSAGLDAYFFLRYIRMCLQISMVSGLWGMCILWPVFSSGGNGMEGWYRLGMANIAQASWRLWVPAIFMWLTTLYVFFLMNEEYKHYIQLRMEYLAGGDAGVHHQQRYTLMLERIPHELRADRALYEYFDALFPGRVYGARVVLNLPDLERVAAKRKQAVGRLEKSIAYFEAKGKRATHVVGRQRFKCLGVESMPIIPSGGRGRRSSALDDESLATVTVDDTLPRRGERVDSIHYYTRVLADMNDKIAKMQEEKISLAAEGNDTIKASQWIEHAIGVASDAAATALSGNQEEADGLVLGFQKAGTGQNVRHSIHQLGIDFLFGGLAYLNRKLDIVVDSVSGATMSATGFVTFKDMATVTCAVRAPLSQDPDVLNAAVAPEPRDIKWENAHINLDWSNGRASTANILLCLGAILWSVPVAGIQAIANIDSIAAAPGMGWISNFGGPRLVAFVNGYLPVMALLCIILLLPIIFERIAVSYELRKTYSDVQKATLGRYFYYQLANIYITVSAGSLWDSVGEILNHPSAAFEILGKSLPAVVGYFVTLLITKALAGLPMVMLRFGALFRMLFLRLCFNQKLLTQRELDEVYKKETLRYGWEYPTQLLVIVICFTYACISPVILPVGAMYFLGALLVYKKQVLVVYTPEYESGGELFPSVCQRTLIGLICGQVTLIGYSILREGFYQPLILFPLPIMTVLMMRVFWHLYAEPGMYLSLERAMKFDRHATDELQFSEDTYRQPVLAEKSVEPQMYRTSGTPEKESKSPSFFRQGLGVLHDDSNKVV